MALDIWDGVKESCEQLALTKELITSRRVQKALISSQRYPKDQITSQAHKIPRMISKWRISRVNEQKKDLPAKEKVDIYKSLQIPKQNNKKHFNATQKKIYSLENEVNRYKHSLSRANSKIKFLEKKLQSFKSQSSNQRREVIDSIKTMLAKNSSSEES